MKSLIVYKSNYYYFFYNFNTIENLVFLRVDNNCFVSPKTSRSKLMCVYNINICIRNALDTILIITCYFI